MEGIFTTLEEAQNQNILELFKALENRTVEQF